MAGEWLGSCLQTESYCRLLLLVLSAVSSEATSFLTSSSVTVYPSVSSTIVFNAFSSSSGSTMTVSESTYLPPHKSTSSVLLQSTSLTQLQSTSSVLYQSASSMQPQSTYPTSHEITSSVPTTDTVHPTTVDMESLIVCVVFGVVFGIFVLVSFTIFCLLLKHQLTNDQPHVRSFMMDKVLITIYDGDGDISNSENHSDTHSDDLTDEDSNDSATTPLLSL